VAPYCHVGFIQIEIGIAIEIEKTDFDPEEKNDIFR